MAMITATREAPIMMASVTTAKYVKKLNWSRSMKFEPGQSHSFNKLSKAAQVKIFPESFSKFKERNLDSGRGFST